MVGAEVVGAVVGEGVGEVGAVVGEGVGASKEHRPLCHIQSLAQICHTKSAYV